MTASISRSPHSPWVMSQPSDCPRRVAQRSGSAGHLAAMPSFISLMGQYTSRRHRVACSWRHPACMVLDGTNVDQWQWQAGTYEILFASGSAIKRRLALALEAPVPHPTAFEANVSASSAGARLATAAVNFMMSAFSPDTSMAAGTAVFERNHW